MHCHILYCVCGATSLPRLYCIVRTKLSYCCLAWSGCIFFFFLQYLQFMHTEQSIFTIRGMNMHKVFLRLQAPCGKWALGQNANFLANVRIRGRHQNSCPNCHSHHSLFPANLEINSAFMCYLQNWIWSVPEPYPLSRNLEIRTGFDVPMPILYLKKKKKNCSCNNFSFRQVIARKYSSHINLWGSFSLEKSISCSLQTEQWKINPGLFHCFITPCTEWPVIMAAQRFVSQCWRKKKRTSNILLETGKLYWGVVQ